jgi:hypothetical protein
MGDAWKTKPRYQQKGDYAVQRHWKMGTADNARAVADNCQ